MPEPTAVSRASVEHDYPCIGCEYILYGLPREGKCPECGLAVEETLRPFEGDVRIPWRVRIVAGLLIASGLWSLFELFPNLASRMLDIPVEALALPAGFGLMRLSNRWRVGVVICLSLELLMLVALAALVAAHRPAAVPVSILSVPVARVSTLHFLAAVLGFVLAIAWAIRMLLDRRFAMLCRVIGSRMHWIKPGIHARYRGYMLRGAAASLMAGALLAGGMLLFGEKLDRWSMSRHARIQEAVRADTAASSTPQQRISFAMGLRRLRARAWAATGSRQA